MCACVRVHHWLRCTVPVFTEKLWKPHWSCYLCWVSPTCFSLWIRGRTISHKSFSSISTPSYNPSRWELGHWCSETVANIGKPTHTHGESCCSLMRVITELQLFFRGDVSGYRPSYDATMIWSNILAALSHNISPCLCLTGWTGLCGHDCLSMVIFFFLALFSSQEVGEKRLLFMLSVFRSVWQNKIFCQ